MTLSCALTALAELVLSILMSGGKKWSSQSLGVPPVNGYRGAQALECLSVYSAKSDCATSTRYQEETPEITRI